MSSGVVSKREGGKVFFIKKTMLSPFSQELMQLSGFSDFILVANYRSLSFNAQQGIDCSRFGKSQVRTATGLAGFLESGKHLAPCTDNVSCSDTSYTCKLTGWRKSHQLFLKV
jgi:hypothetical protein